MGRGLSSFFRFRWPATLINISTFRNLIPSSSALRRQLPGMEYLSVVRRAVSQFPELDLSVLDDVAWGVVMAFESVALVAMMGFFFLFCGCTL